VVGVAAAARQGSLPELAAFGARGFRGFFIGVIIAVNAESGALPRVMIFAMT